MSVYLFDTPAIPSRAMLSVVYQSLFGSGYAGLGLTATLFNKASALTLHQFL